MAKKREKSAAIRDSYHHGDLRRALLRAARAEISRKGAAALTLSSLARRAHVSQPAPYRHFADREALLADVATEGFRELTASLVEAATNGDAKDALKRLGLAYVRFGVANIELYRLMFASRIVPESEPGGMLKTAADDSYAVLLKTVSARRPQGDPEETAHLIWAQVHGLVMLKADGFLDESLEGLVERIPL